MAYSIVTGNGFIGNAQRAGDFWGDGGLFNIGFKFENYTYNLSFKYRSNGILQAVGTSGNDLLPSAPIIVPITGSDCEINLGDATLKTVNGITGSSHLGRYLGFNPYIRNYASVSSTNVTIPTSFPTTVNATIETGKDYAAGVIVKFIRNPFTFFWFRGTVISYNSGTGDISISVTSSQGTGTYNSWYVSAEGGIWAEFDEVNLYQL